MRTLVTIYLAMLGLSYHGTNGMGRQNQKSLWWDRQYRGITVREDALVNIQEMTIRMTSEDDDVIRQGFNKSESLHDYQTMKVALKMTDEKGTKWCFISDIEKGFKETVRELFNRHKTTYVADNLTPKTEVICDVMNHAQLRAFGGIKLRQFCVDATTEDRTYKLRSYDPTVDIQFRTWRWPWITWCIWWPWHIYITIDINIDMYWH